MSISSKRLEEIRAFKNEDFEDSPVLTKEQMSQMVTSHLVNKKLWKPQKQVLNVRIDADILEKMKSHGKGWQSRLNDFLRNAVTTGQL